MATKTRMPHLALLAAAAVLAGCATPKQMEAGRKDGQEKVQQASDRTRQIDAAVARVTQRRHVDEDEVQRPFLAGAPVPLAPEVALPPALRQGVKTSIITRDGKRDLMSLAEGITRATGIPVRVKPDALLPPSAFLPRAVASGGSASAGGAESTLVDIRAEDAPLNAVLDRIASRLSVSWRFDGKAIEIYRLESRSFQAKVLPIKVSTQAGLGRSAAQAGAFDNSSGTKYTGTESDPFAALRAAIEARMTRAGTGPVISPETGTIVVTDTPDALDAIEQYIERENRLFSRRVDLVFEAIQVRVRDTGQVGFDWTAVYEALRGEITRRLSLDAPSPLVADTAGSMGLAVRGGRFAGSDVVIKALSEIGTIVNATRVPVQTVNRRPASYAMRTTFNYIDQATGAATSVAGGAAATGPTITQKDETVGTILTIVPDVDDDGVVAMSVSYDTTALARLEPFTTGAGETAITVQQKEISGAGVLQQISTRVGVPTVIGGFERSTREATGRRLDRSLPIVLGGSDRSVDEREITVLMVTAIAKDGL